MDNSVGADSLKYLMRRRLSRGLTSLRGRAGEEAKACLAVKTNGVPEGAMLEFAISVYMMVQASPEDRALYIFSILDTNGNKQAGSLNKHHHHCFALCLSPGLLGRRVEGKEALGALASVVVCMLCTSYSSILGGFIVSSRAYVKYILVCLIVDGRLLMCPVVASFRWLVFLW